MSKVMRSMHAIAACRGDGLLPELVALLDQCESRSEVIADSEALTNRCANANSHSQNADTSKQYGFESKIDS